MHAHLPGNVGKDAMAVFQLNPEHCIRQGLNHQTFNFYRLLFSHF
jgi:hypothetical protein